MATQRTGKTVAESQPSDHAVDAALVTSPVDPDEATAGTPRSGEGPLTPVQQAEIPATTAAPDRSTPSAVFCELLLRVCSALTTSRAQQSLIAALIALCLLLAGIDWYRYGGGMIGPVDIERDSPLPYDYRVDVNTADWIELAQLPGVGPTLARRIVAERARGGPFSGPQDLQERVRGIGPNTLERFRAWIRFSQAPSSSLPHSSDR